MRASERDGGLVNAEQRSGRLGRWRLGPVASAVERVLVAAGLAAAAPPGASIAVVDHVRLARALVERGWRVAVTEPTPRALRRAHGLRVTCLADAPPFASARLAAVVGAVGDRRDWAVVLAAWGRAVVPGGVIVVIDAGAATEASRRVLCAGLMELEQRVVGRTVITSGRVAKLDPKVTTEEKGATGGRSAAHS
jgi:hypothetical protein